MKALVTNYSFNHSARTVTFTDYNPVLLRRLYLITNVTRNEVIYNFAKVGSGGAVATNVLTLQYDTTGHADTDKLQIIYETFPSDADYPVLSVIGAVTVGNFPSFPAIQPVSVATPYQVAGSAETNSIYQGVTALTPKFAVIVASASGRTTVVGNVGGKKIRVLSYVLVSNGSVNVKFQSANVAPTDKTGLLYLVANSGVAAAFNPVGHFESIAGEGIDINLSSASAVGGHLTYIEA